MKTLILAAAAASMIGMGAALGCGGSSTSGTTGATGTGGAGTTTTTTTASTTAGTGGSTATSTSTGSTAMCGDGVLDGAEACDDGNLVGGDGCTAACEKECSSLSFAGATQAVAAMPATLSPKSVTLAAWYKATTGAAAGTIAGKKGDPVSAHLTYFLGVGPEGLRTRLQTDVNFLDIVHAPAVPDSQWHHAAVTYDATSGKGQLFFDGSPFESGTLGTGLVAADVMQPFAIGATALGAAFEIFFNGAIADVVVYDQALSAADVQGLSMGQYPAAKPLALFLVHEGAGVTSSDESGNGHTLAVPAAGWAMDGPFCK